MPIIILVEPFIRHYAGSVFRVSDAIGYSGWDEDDRVRDRQPCHDKRVYNLPDNGKGLPCELPIDYTVLCPEDVFKDADIKSGPCRITSVSDGLKSLSDDPFYADPLPMGMGKVLLNNSYQYVKNLITVDIPIDNTFNKVVIRDLVTEEIVHIVYDFQNGFQLDFSDFDPGFYKGDLFYNTNLLHSFTMMKCFPLVVKFSRYSEKYTTSPTLW